jgi:hypothetical protein
MIDWSVIRQIVREEVDRARVEDDEQLRILIREELEAARPDWMAGVRSIIRVEIGDAIARLKEQT